MAFGRYPAISEALRAEITTGIVVMRGLCQMVSWSLMPAPAPSGDTGGCGHDLARSAEVMRHAAAPPEGMTHSSQCRGSLTMREVRTSSTVIGCPGTPHSD